MDIIMKMYVTLFPAIFAGVLNMIWCKIPLGNSLKKPIDGGKLFIDGKRILGDNKTWKGFIGYIVLNIITYVVWGYICAWGNFSFNNYFYLYHDNALLYNIEIGFLIGLFYALFELPNSFLKRRLQIEPGKPAQGIKKIFFIILDQADSVFGMCLVVALFCPITVFFYLEYVLVGTVTHFLINLLLFFLKLRKNPF